VNILRNENAIGIPASIVDCKARCHPKSNHSYSITCPWVLTSSLPGVIATHPVNSLLNSRQTRGNVYDGCFRVPVQPHASQTSQSVVRIHHLDRGRVIIANQSITRSHSIHSATCDEVFQLVPTFCGEPPRFSSKSSTLQTGST